MNISLIPKMLLFVLLFTVDLHSQSVSEVNLVNDEGKCILESAIEGVVNFRKARHDSLDTIESIILVNDTLSIIPFLDYVQLEPQFLSSEPFEFLYPEGYVLEPGYSWQNKCIDTLIDSDNRIRKGCVANIRFTPPLLQSISRKIYVSILYDVIDSKYVYQCVYSLLDNNVVKMDQCYDIPGLNCEKMIDFPNNATKTQDKSKNEWSPYLDLPMEFKSSKKN